MGKKSLIILLTGVVLLIAAAVAFNPGGVQEKADRTETSERKDRRVQNENITGNISMWYEVAESEDYKIFTSGARGGSVTTVLHKKSDTLLVPSESCEVKISSQEKNKQDANFYNKTVGIIKQGPYKVINYQKGTGNSFRQTVSSGGCVSEEGKITLLESAIRGKVNCRIDINYRLLGC